MVLCLIWRYFALWLPDYGAWALQCHLGLASCTWLWSKFCRVRILILHFYLHAFVGIVGSQLSLSASDLTVSKFRELTRWLRSLSSLSSRPICG